MSQRGETPTYLKQRERIGDVSTVSTVSSHSKQSNPTRKECDELHGDVEKHGDTFEDQHSGMALASRSLRVSRSILANGEDRPEPDVSSLILIVTAGRRCRSQTLTARLDDDSARARSRRTGAVRCAVRRPSEECDRPLRARRQIRPGAHKSRRRWSVVSHLRVGAG
jgi:hypothetical protein